MNHAGGNNLLMFVTLELKGLRRLGSDVVGGKGVVVKIICYSQSSLQWALLVGLW